MFERCIIAQLIACAITCALHPILNLTTQWLHLQFTENHKKRKKNENNALVNETH